MNRDDLRRLWKRTLPAGAAWAELAVEATYRPPAGAVTPPTVPADQRPTVRPESGDTPPLPTPPTEILEAGEATGDRIPRTPTVPVSGPAAVDTPAGAGGGSTSARAPVPLGEAGLPGYELLEEIGRGGMGVVHRAYQKSLRREVAIKRIRTDLQSEAARERFACEARVTGFLDHPNIVPVHALGTGERDLLLAMKLVGGQPWRDALRSRSEEDGFDLAAHLRIFLSVCNAVAFAHTKGIVHLDLKPANVMVGAFGEVLVMDWGLAVEYTGDASPESRTFHRSQLTAPCGTPAYMPPELAEARGDDIGPWTDVYLLGAILYEVVVGRPPHAGKDLLEVLAAASAGALAALPDRVPADLQAICRRALAARPADRYPDVPALREALEAFLAHRESRRIGAAARAQLEECRQEATRQRTRAASDRARNQLYASFAEVVAGFRQALVLWEQNPDAATGARAARLAYADAALRYGDLGLAAAQIEDLEDRAPDAATLRERIAAEKLARQRTARTGRRLRRGLVGAVVTIVCGLAVGVALVNRARQNAVDALARERAAKTQLASSFHDQGVQALQRHEALSAEVLLARALTLDDRLATRERLLEARGKAVRLLRVLRGKGGVVLTHVAYSPDGRRLAAAATDGTIRFWDAETGRELPPLRGHEKLVVGCAFRPNGQRLVSTSIDGTVRLWDLGGPGRSRGTSRILQGQENEPYGVAFSPDGRSVAAAGKDGKVRVWDVDAPGGPRLTLSAHPQEAWSVAFSPDGRYLATGGTLGTVRLWNPATGEAVVSRMAHRSAKVSDLAFSPDGQRLASGGGDGSIRLWDTGERDGVPQLSSGHLDVLSGHQGEVVTLAFSPSGQRLASGGADGTVRLWNVPLRREVLVLLGHTKDVNGVSFRPDGRQLASASADRTVRIWDLAREIPEVMSLPEQRGAPARIAFSPDGRLVAASGADKAVRLWLTDDPSRPPRHLDHPSAIASLAFGRAGRRLAVCGVDGAIRLWNVSGEMTAAFRTQVSLTNWLVLSPDLARVAGISPARPREVQIRDVKNDALLRRLPVPGRASTATFNRDGRRLAVGSLDDLTLSVWNLEAGDGVSWSSGHKDMIVGLAFSPDGRRLASSGRRDQFIRLWSLPRGKLLGTLPGHDPEVGPVVFGPGGRRLASGGHDGAVRVWDVPSERALFALRGHGHHVSAIAFSPDGHRVAAGSEARALRLWNLPAVERFLRAPAAALLREAQRAAGVETDASS